MKLPWSATEALKSLGRWRDVTNEAAHKHGYTKMVRARQHDELPSRAPDFRASSVECGTDGMSHRVVFHLYRVEAHTDGAAECQTCSGSRSGLRWWC